MTAVESTAPDQCAQERWLPVVGWEGWYEVSDLGRVRRVSTGRIRRNSPPQAGYLRVQLCCGERKKAVFVHRLVAAAFLGPCPEGAEVHHRDGDPANAALSNLQYLPRLEHAMIHGRLTAEGAILDPDDVAIIRDTWGRNAELAARFGVSIDVIRGVRKRALREATATAQ